MTPDHDSEDGRLRLAYNEGFRVLTQQRDDLERLRTRATALVSVGALTAGIVGGISGTHAQPHSVWLYVGLSAFGVLILCVCVLLAPHTTIFETDPRVLLNDYVDAGYDLNSTLRWSAHYLGENGDENRKLLDRLSNVYLAALVALGITIAAFAIALLGRTG